jgi:hypothetical protein
MVHNCTCQLILEFVKCYPIVFSPVDDSLVPDTLSILVVFWPLLFSLLPSPFLPGQVIYFLHLLSKVTYSMSPLQPPCPSYHISSTDSLTMLHFLLISICYYLTNTLYFYLFCLLPYSPVEWNHHENKCLCVCVILCLAQEVFNKLLLTEQMDKFDLHFRGSVSL